MDMSKKLLITGGTGSFGTAFLKKALVNNGFGEIRIFSRDEKKQDDLRKDLNDSRVKFYIGDVRDYSSISQAANGVDYIFHSAALKQVPSCEFFPLEAIKTNILGTENVLLSAEAFEVKKVVILSTDKAAYPINAMGMTKALMEKVMVAKSRNLDDSKTVFCGTRYGNVMASRGSVIPLFIDQIKTGKPLTITDPEMTRFMMTLDNAVELVLYALKNGKQGEMFVQKAPAAKVSTLAQALLELYDSKSPIQKIGIRHGEKKYETLVTSEEMVQANDLGKYYSIGSDNRDLNYAPYFSEGNDNDNLIDEYNSNNAEHLDVSKMKKLLMQLPELKNDPLIKL
ncbi:polysaccharide biosynthesis protein [Flavobacteriaceae bacterium]|nr:polysaccharide biosynthesis protein [Flavobacteriaceae bacterium]